MAPTGHAPYGPFVRPDRLSQAAGRRSPARIGDVQAVLGWCQRARPARVEGARRLEREVEVQDHRARGRIAAEVRALRGVDQVAAGAVGLGAVGRVAERDEEAARVAGHPEHGQRTRAGRERDGDPADAAEGERVGAAVGQLDREGAGGRRRGRFDRRPRSGGSGRGRSGRPGTRLAPRSGRATAGGRGRGSRGPRASGPGRWPGRWRPCRGPRRRGSRRDGASRPARRGPWWTRRPGSSQRTRRTEL